MEILHGGAEGQLGVLYSSSSSKNRGSAVKMEVSESDCSEETVSWFCLLWVFTEARSSVFSKNIDTHMADKIPCSRAEKDGMKFVYVLFHGKCQ